MIDLHLDFETRSVVDLTRCGLDNYSAHPSARVLMVGWAVNDEPPKLWLPQSQSMPQRLRYLLDDPAVLVYAWNAQFERVMMERVLGIRIALTRWRCSMVRAMMLALPGKLDDCGKVLRLGQEFQKSAEGKRLIRIFCIPHKPTKQFPGDGISEWVWYDETTHLEEWKTFCHYCLQDVISERKIDKLLAKYPVAHNAWGIYALDQKINDRGVPLDMQFVQNAITMFLRRKKEIASELNALTGLKNSNSTQQLLPWVKARGYPFGSLEKSRVKKALLDFADSLTPECKVALRLRLTGAKTSVQKFTSMLKRVGADGRLRYAFQMAGAGRTMRWAGRGVQLQNLARPLKDFEKFLAEIREMVLAGDYEGIKTYFGEPIDVLSSSVRSAIAAPPGRRLRVCDLASIETRLVGWEADCDALNEVFRKGLDAYKVFATEVYGVSYDEVNKEQRGMAKPATLGCAYMLSGGVEVGVYPDTIKTGLWAYAESMGVRLTRDEAHRQVAVFRTAYPEVTALWGELDDAAQRAITTRLPQKAGVVEFDVMAPFLRMKLPSGRHIYYLRPKIRDHVIKHPGGTFVKRGISYEGKNKIGQWVDNITTHGGKWVEQHTQGIAADVLIHGMLLADADGFDIAGHVHDEQITEADEFNDEHSVERLRELMSVVPAWAPGLLLDAAGYDSDFYKKD